MRAAHFLAVATGLGLILGACGPENPAPAKPLRVGADQTAVDTASTAYARCVDKAVAAVDPATDQAAALADRAVKSCAKDRAEVAAKIVAMRVAGGMDAATAATIAERSVRVADSELRERANAVIVTRKLKAGG